MPPLRYLIAPLLVAALVAYYFFSYNALVPEPVATDYPVIPVTDGIFYHQGVHEEMNEANLGAIANVSFVIGKRCVAVIDSGGSYQEGIKLRKAIAAKTPLPVCYVINTHTHPDHLFGNAAFVDDKPEFVGHTKLDAALTSRQPFFDRVFKERLGAAYAGTEFIVPTLVVEIDMPLTLDIGGRTLTLQTYPTAHTDHDVTVLDSATNTFWTGDLMFVGRIPVIDGHLGGLIDVMAEIQQADYAFVIPGHGRVSADTWHADLANQQRYFNVIRDEIREIIADFGTIQQATKTVGLSEENNWELFPQYHRRNITTAFTELEWE